MKVIRRKVTITAVGAVMSGALAFGAASPAFACDSTSDNSAAATSSTSTTMTAHHARLVAAPTFEQKKAWALASVTFWQQTLNNYAQLVAANPYLTDAQKTKFAAKATAANQAFDNLKAAISAAVTPEQLRTALVDGWKAVKWPLFKHPGRHWGNFKGGDLKGFAKVAASVSYAKAHPTAYVTAYRSVYLKHHHWHH